MKKITLLATLGAVTAATAGSAQHAYLYKDPRMMGMGGVGVATSKYSTSVFSNPASILSIPKENGFEVELLGLSLGASKNFSDLTDDLDDASDAVDETAATADVLSEYSGEHFHLDISNYSSVSKNGDAFAWTVGLLAASDVNMIPHANGGNNGALETQSRGYGGVILGAAKSYDNVGYGDFRGALDVGVGVKFIQQTSYDGGVSVSEIVDNSDDIVEYMRDKYEEDSTGYGMDIGVNYHIFPASSLKPVVGMSVLNIGSMDMDDNYGQQPTTVNIGMAIEPEIPYTSHFKIGVDYMDVFDANKYYDYEFSESNGVINEVVKHESDDTDMMKRLRLGLSYGVVENSYVTMTLKGGLYQGNYTAGVDMQLAFFNLQASTYEEEIGPEAGDVSDRRYNIGIGLGW